MTSSGTNAMHTFTDYGVLYDMYNIKAYSFVKVFFDQSSYDTIVPITCGALVRIILYENTYNNGWINPSIP